MPQAGMRDNGNKRRDTWVSRWEDLNCAEVSPLQISYTKEMNQKRFLINSEYTKIHWED